jgi:hypothetical protein
MEPRPHPEETVLGTIERLRTIINGQDRRLNKVLKTIGIQHLDSMAVVYDIRKALSYAEMLAAHFLERNADLRLMSLPMTELRESHADEQHNLEFGLPTEPSESPIG